MVDAGQSGLVLGHVGELLDQLLLGGRAPPGTPSALPRPLRDGQSIDSPGCGEYWPELSWYSGTSGNCSTSFFSSSRAARYSARASSTFPRPRSRTPRLWWVLASWSWYSGTSGNCSTSFFPSSRAARYSARASSDFPRSSSRIPRLLWVLARSSWYSGTSGNCSTSFFWSSRAAAYSARASSLRPSSGPQDGDAEVPLAADGQASLVVPLPVGVRLPALQGVFQIRLLFRTEFRLRPDQLLDGIVGARSVVGQRVGLGLLGNLSLRGLRLGQLIRLGPFASRFEQADRRADDAGQQRDEDQRQGDDCPLVLPQELSQSIGSTRRAGLDRLVVQVVAGCRRRRRWPSRSGGCGPSPAPSSRSSPARRGPTRFSFGPARCCRLAAIEGSASLELSRVLGLGGSSSRMIRSISSNAASCSRFPPERRRAGQAARRAARPENRCRCGCRCRAG